MADGELLDAREAMSMLGINENDLQTLVARGDLRAFRSAGTMKFRRDDVMSLKTDKGTEPTIIIPAASGTRKSASGILPAIPAAAHAPATQRPGSRIMPAVGRAPAPAPAPAPVPINESATSDIVLDDIELMPTDDASVTNQVTAAQPAIDMNIGGATVLETAQEAAQDAPATGPAQAVSGSGRRAGVQGAPTVAPAVSRVQRSVAPGVSMATSKRTQAVYAAKSASPFITIVAGLNTALFLFAATIVGTMMTRGTFDKQSGERIIPPFLNHNSTLPVYRWCYESTPGNPADKKPSSEYDPRGGK
ncbi:MAG TPA: helix-turn-helix domain-containing protein [Planctomycetota bacterium]|jgi:hypothetical protein